MLSKYSLYSIWFYKSLANLGSSFLSGSTSESHMRSLMAESSDSNGMRYGATGQTRIAMGFVQGTPPSEEFYKVGNGNCEEKAFKRGEVSDDTDRTEGERKPEGICDLNKSCDEEDTFVDAREYVNTPRRHTGDISTHVIVTNQCYDNMERTNQNAPGDVTQEGPIAIRHVSFGNTDEPEGQSDDTELMDSITRTQRHVSFTDVNQTEAANSRSDSDLSDSPSRNRTVTTSGHQTHSEAEECGESEASVIMSTETVSFSRRRSGSLLSSLTPRRRRRRRISRHGTVVTDSFVNECICCCSIL